MVETTFDTQDMFFNLTNGIEWLPLFIEAQSCNCKYIRLQSTWCEQHRWDDILADLDYTFLLHLRVRGIAYVFDCSQKKSLSRALYQGLAWVRYALNRCWYNNGERAIIKTAHGKMDVTDYFDKEYKKLSKRTLAKLNYLKKFKGYGKVYIVPHCMRTTHDGDYEFYDEIIQQSYCDPRSNYDKAR